MEDTRKADQSFNPADTFKMDETGYFWKMIPDRSWNTERITGANREQDRITVNLCCNADGSRKMEARFIGTIIWIDM